LGGNQPKGSLKEPGEAPLQAGRLDASGVEPKGRKAAGGPRKLLGKILEEGNGDSISRSRGIPNGAPEHPFKEEEGVKKGRIGGSPERSYVEQKTTKEASSRKLIASGKK